MLTRAETRSDLDIFAAYVNTKRNLVADQGTRVLTGLTSGAEAADRTEEYLGWAAHALPEHPADNWTGYAEDPLLQAGNQDTPELWQEPAPPPGQVGRAAEWSPSAEPTKGPRARGGFFEHCIGVMNLSRALKRLGYEFPGGSEIDEHALDFQRRILGLTDVEPVDFWSDPVSRLTLEGERRLVPLVDGLPYTELSQVNALRKGATDRSAWMATGRDS